MNEPGTRQSEAEFERNARAMFDASIASLDARTLSRLNQARNRALQAASTASSRRHVWLAWVPAAADHLPLYDDRDAAFECPLHPFGGSQRRHAAIDHLLEYFARMATDRRGTGLGLAHRHRQQRDAVHALEPEQVSGIVADRNACGDAALDRLTLGCHGHGLDVGQFERFFVIMAAGSTAQAVPPSMRNDAPVV